tara:strand:+ start:27 stop:203 length:177 start_codon:yes stop_codon:yes gene_type:complete
MTKADGIELALLHALRYEEMNFKSSDTKKRWDINEDEAKIIIKWMNARMNDIKERSNG